jgi:hypothetical protein
MKDRWNMGESIQTDPSRHREVRALRRSLGHEIYDEGRVEGRIEGRVEGRHEGRHEGRIEALREIIIRIGKKRFDSTNADAEAELQAIRDVERLQIYSDRILEAASWAELLASP